MTDTDKYEGHTKGPWTWRGETIDGDGEVNHTVCYMEHPHVNGEMNEADALLITDAPLLLEEVKELREKLDRAEKECGALWSITDCWSMCVDDYSMHDQYENLDERYAHADWGIILKELYTYTEEDGWQPKEMIE